MLIRLISILLALVAVWPIAACRNQDQPQAQVVVYTALDREYAEPILNQFKKQTGIDVLAVYDTEAAKTTGLVSRLIEEKTRPRCDVFWNNEILRTIQLKEMGLVEPYVSPNAATIPEAFKDPQGNWTGFAARLRVLVYNPQLVLRAPATMAELTTATWSGKIALAYPLFGTTASHGAVLFAAWGPERAKEYFTALNNNNVRIVEGNGVACRMVADGEIPLALTDSDDANLNLTQGKPIKMAMLDHDGKGALVIPNTVALVKGAPHADAGRRLIDYLLSPAVELELARSPSAQIPLHAGATGLPPNVAELAREKMFQPDYAAAAGQLQPSADFLKGLFTRP